MTYVRFSSLKISGLLLVILMLISVIGCGSNTNQQTSEITPSDTDTKSEENFSALLPDGLGRHLITDTKLTAQLIIDNDTTKPVDLVVNTTNKSVTGDIKNVKGGTHTFEIIYYITDDTGNKVQVASASTNAVVAAGTNTPITFPQSSIRYFDDDKDGFTNLAELEMGTKYDDASSKRVAELPRSSTNYILSDTMGISPSDGKTTVVGQSKSSNYATNETSVAGQSKSTNYTLY